MEGEGGGGMGGVLMGRSEEHPLVALECCLHVDVGQLGVAQSQAVCEGGWRIP